MHPVEENDIQETINLTQSYIAQPSRYSEEYGFTRNDKSYLIAHNVMKHQPHKITAKNGQLPNQPTRIKEKERGEKREEIEDERETGQEKREPPRKRQMKLTDFQENESSANTAKRGRYAEWGEEKEERYEKVDWEEKTMQNYKKKREMPGKQEKKLQRLSKVGNY